MCQYHRTHDVSRNELEAHAALHPAQARRRGWRPRAGGSPRRPTDLHGSVGPARTTITAVAERAGVQRQTVYRHFATEEDLLVACSAHFAAMHPPPDPEAWQAIADP